MSNGDFTYCILSSNTHTNMISLHCIRSSFINRVKQMQRLVWLLIVCENNENG